LQKLIVVDSFPKLSLSPLSFLFFETNGNPLQNTKYEIAKPNGLDKNQEKKKEAR